MANTGRDRRIKHRIMSLLPLAWGLMLGLMLGLMTPGQNAWAAVAPAQQPAEVITVHLGTAQGELRFQPSELDLVAGQRYTLVLDNPSDQKHYFTAKDFADALWTQNVKTAGVEVKGAIHELELKPGASAEWTLIPQKTGQFELHCSIPGHREAGMIGQIRVNVPV